MTDDNRHRSAKEGPEHRLRLLHVIETMSPQAGGPAEAVRALVLYGERGYDSEVVSLDAPGSLYLTKYPFSIHALGPAKGVYGYSRTLLSWLRNNADQFDGVVVHGLWQYCGHAVRRVFGGRTPYVVFTHGMLDPYFKRVSPLKHAKKWLYWMASEFWTLRRAQWVLFTTDAEERLAKQSFWLQQWKGLVAPLGAPEPDGDPERLAEMFFTQCSNVRGRAFLLFLGRIHRKKGCDLLLRAFGEVAPHDPELHLVMAGPDSQGWSQELRRAATAAGVADRVHWPGMLEGDAKWGALLSSQAFVLPSHQENFGIAVAEALACSRPVLLSDKVNIAQEIAGDGAGLVESDTTEGTLRLLERWLATSTRERTRMERQARACFDTRYNIARNAATILALFGPPHPGACESTTSAKPWSELTVR